VSSDSHLRLFDVRAPPPPLSSPLPSSLSSPPPLIPLSQPLPAAALTIPIHAPTYAPAEALTHDWNKYREHLVAVAGVDRLIRTFDVRGGTGGGNNNNNINGGIGSSGGFGGPLAVLPGHAYAVRRLAWSPHLPDVLLSASYDMTCRVWIFNNGGGSSKSSSGGGGGGGGISSSSSTSNGGNAGDGGGFGGAGAGAGGGAREAGHMAAHTEFVTGVDWCLFGAEGWCASCAWDERVLVWDVRSVLQ
jgi:peroxin-7